MARSILSWAKAGAISSSAKIGSTVSTVSTRDLPPTSPCASSTPVSTEAPIRSSASSIWSPVMERVAAGAVDLAEQLGQAGLAGRLRHPAAVHERLQLDPGQLVVLDQEQPHPVGQRARAPPGAG